MLSTFLSVGKLMCTDRIAQTRINYVWRWMAAFTLGSHITCLYIHKYCAYRHKMWIYISRNYFGFSRTRLLGSTQPKYAILLAIFMPPSAGASSGPKFSQRAQLRNGVNMEWWWLHYQNMAISKNYPLIWMSKLHLDR